MVLESYIRSSLHSNHTDISLFKIGHILVASCIAVVEKIKKGQSERDNRKIPLRQRESKKPRTSLNNY